MNYSSPRSDDCDGRLPAEASFDDVTQRLNEELQQAAFKLLNHLQAQSYRTRMRGSPYGTYLTIGWGRHTDEGPGGFNEAASPPATELDFPPEKQHEISADHRRKLRPFVSSV